MFREGILFIFLLEHIRSNLRTPDCNEFTQCRFLFNTSFKTFHRSILFLGLHVHLLYPNCSQVQMQIYCIHIITRSRCRSTVSILFLGLDVDFIISILFLGLEVVLRYPYRSQVQMQICNIQIVSRSRYRSTISILFLGLDIDVQYPYCSQVQIQMYNIHIVPRFRCRSKISILFLGLDVDLQYPYSFLGLEWFYNIHIVPRSKVVLRYPYCSQVQMKI